MEVARLHKTYVATAESGCVNPWLSGAPQSAKAAWHEVPGNVRLRVRTNSRVKVPIGQK